MKSSQQRQRKREADDMAGVQLGTDDREWEESHAHNTVIPPEDDL